MEPEKDKIREVESKMVAARGWGVGETGRWCSKGINFQL